MAKLNVTVVTEKCQGYGVCAKLSPDVFQVGPDSKAVAGDPSAAPDDVVLRAARSCPYRAVIVINEETGEQLIPRIRTKQL